MVKMVILLNRSDEYSHDEFVERLREEHAPMAENLSGLQRYTTHVPLDPEEAGYDGISELHFEDPGDIGEAFGSDLGQRVQDDAAEFMDVEQNETMVVDEAVHLDR